MSWNFGQEWFKNDYWLHRQLYQLCSSLSFSSGFNSIWNLIMKNGSSLPYSATNFFISSRSSVASAWEMNLSWGKSVGLKICRTSWKLSATIVILKHCLLILEEVLKASLLQVHLNIKHFRRFEFTFTISIRVNHLRSRIFLVWLEAEDFSSHQLAFNHFQKI